MLDIRYNYGSQGLKSGQGLEGLTVWRDTDE